MIIVKMNMDTAVIKNKKMKKIVLIFLLIPLFSIGQGIKVKDLPTTTTGTSNDFLIKDYYTGTSGSTQKISVQNFIDTYISNSFLAIPSTYTTVIAATDTFYIRKTSNGTYYKVPYSSVYPTLTGTSPIIVNTNTISITDAAADGSTKGAASFTANDFNSSSGNISIDYANGDTASSSQNGFMSSYTYNNLLSQWTTTGSDIYYNTGNVGIGNSSPDAKIDVVSTSTVNPVASFSVNTSGSDNATGVNINAEGGTTTDALVVNSKSNVSGGINNAIVALATTANGGYNNALTSVAQNGDYNYAGKILAQGGVDAVGLSISSSGASGSNKAIDVTSGTVQIASTSTTVATRPFIVINGAGDTILQLHSRGMIQTGTLEENLYFGYNSGLRTTTGTYNTSHGKYDLAFLTTGSYNTATGHGSLYKMTSGTRNTGFGVNTLYNDTSGGYNVALGMESQNQNLSGNYNVSAGYSAAYTNKTGSSNVAIGRNALFSNRGSANVAIGDNAAYYGIWTNKLFINNKAESDSANTIRKALIYGEFATDSSDQQVRINGRIKITGGSYGNGKVLTSDANGLASWNTLASIGGVTGTGTNNYVNFWTGTSTQSADASFIWDNTNKAILLNSASYGTERIGITAGSKYGVNVGLTAASGWAAYRAFVNSSSTTITDNIGCLFTNTNTTAGSGIAFQLNAGGTVGMLGYATYVDANNSKYSMHIKSSSSTTQVVTMDGSTKMASFGYGITTPLSALYVGNSLTLTPTSRKGALLRVGDFTITDNNSAGSATEIVGNSMGAIAFAGINNRTFSYGTGTFLPKPSAGTNVTISTGGLFGFGTDGSGYIEESLSINKDASSNIPTERLDVGGNIVLSGQAYNPIYTIAHTATVTPNWDNSGMQKVTLASATTVANSTNLKSGAVYTVYLYQDATGGRVITWGSQYKFPTAVAPTLTATPSALDIITFVSDGTNLYMAGIVYDLQ